tara:strand:+ start:807 stop:1370 length:564 start_codon:yes stop_codon:yes gene_type:complete
MIKINLTKELLKKSADYSEGKHYNRSIRGVAGTNIGAIGEFVLEEEMKGRGLDVIDNRTSDKATEYDFLVNGQKVEVKTKDRTVPPKPFYECSIPLYNHEHQQPDWFVFLSLHRQDNPYMGDVWYEDAYILGGCTYEYIQEVGITVMKGELDPSNGWLCNESCINIPISKLTEPHPLFNRLAYPRVT